MDHFRGEIMKKLKIVLLVSYCLLLSLTGVSFAEENLESSDVIIKKCINCCNKKYLVCINLNPDRRLCAAELDNCVLNCKTEGKTTSDWSECWSASSQ